MSALASTYIKVNIIQYDVKTPSEYIEILDDDWRREKLEELRALRASWIF